MTGRTDRMGLVDRVGLELELACWARRGQRPQLWWRDDDARAPTLALDRLLALAGEAPLALAIVPDGDLHGLGRRLAGSKTLTVSQHGVDHQNRRAAGAPPSEYPAGTSPQAVAATIDDARRRMEAAGLSPVFYTPPWNQIDETLAIALPLSGHTGLSAERTARGVAGLARFDSDLDILRWKPGPRFRGFGRIATSLVRQLKRRRIAEDFAAPIGLLTHHLVHDEPAWAFLEWFLPFGQAEFDWRRFDDLALPPVARHGEPGDRVMRLGRHARFN